MDIEVKSSFGIVDYCVFGVMLLVSILIGVYTSLIGNKSPDEFLLGNRSFSPTPVAMSLLTSFVSSISLLGFSGEAYAYGAQLSFFVVGTVLGITASGLLILPVLYPLKLTSVNEYISLRFKSKRLHSFISFLTCCQGLLYMGVCLYAPTISLVAVTDIGFLTYIFLLGTICTVYSSFGGIRAVVWTDVFQLSVMVIGLVVIDVLGCIKAGGIKRIWSVATDGGRLNVFNMNPSLYERHSFYNTIAFGFFFYSCIYGISQINVQRICSVKKLSDAKIVLILNAIGMVIIYFLIFSGGLIAYATYAECDPLSSGTISRKEEILPHFIIDHFSFIPGLPGIFVATLIGGTLSSLSSTLNSVVAMIWRDACLKLDFFKYATSQTSMIVNKVLSLLVGCCLIAVAAVASKASSLIELALSVSSVVLGPVFGVYILGMFFPKCNVKGAWAGLISSLFFVSWLSVGATATKREAQMLQFSLNGCEDFENLANDTSIIQTVLKKKKNETMEAIEESQKAPLAFLYDISYTLYCVISPITCVVVGNIVSIVTGGQKLSEVSPMHITPVIRKYLWTELELEEIEQRENKLYKLRCRDDSISYEWKEKFMFLGDHDTT